MKVYVVLQSNTYTEYEFCGVYATREKAQQRLEEILSETTNIDDGLYIEEYELT